MQIGSFTSTGVGYAGHIKTLTLDAEITLEPNRSTSAKSPDFRVFHGTTELGYGYKETSESGVEYVSLKLDDPSFAYPIYCSLFLTSKTDQLSLVWNRPKKKAT
jgi:uncharacterized protein (DUF736 family)